jgi:hypothetical protein
MNPDSAVSEAGSSEPARGAPGQAADAAGRAGRRPIVDWRLFRQHGTLTCPPGMAAGLAFGSIILAIAGFSGGIVSLGTAGLLVLGLAIGLAGRMRVRLMTAAILWAAHAALAAAVVAVGESGFAAISPALYVLLVIAAGQGGALVLSVAFYRR